MADNVAQSIKDLDERIKSLDKGLQNTMNLSQAIAENSKMLGDVMMQAFKKGSDESKEAVKNLKELNKTITDNFGSGKEIKIAIGIEKDKLRKEIAEVESKIKDSRYNKMYTKGLEKDLSAYKKQRDQLVEFEKVYTRINQIVNAGKGNAGTLLGNARATEMNKVRTTMEEINKQIDRRTQLEKTLSDLQARNGKSATFEGQRMTAKQLNDEIGKINQSIERYKRTLASLGGRGRQALGALGGDGSKTAIKDQMAAMRELYNLTRQYRQMQESRRSGKIVNEQDLIDTRNRLREILNQMKQIEAEHPGSRKTAAMRLETERLRDRWREVNREVKPVKGSLESMLPTLRRLASAFGVAFSVQGLVNFGRKLVETRGEFEMQFVAMKSIIGDVDAATKIWNQTMQQALQSPKTFKELTTYTKQLAAYRIETDKLFDTTKRLADVSAGLGVDMGRLILAYGQVKAANYLRASEVRQFTEAGVNIYGELARYFSEIEGRAVGTAEVVERVSKRMVLFSDVEKIFQRMTDEGGTFFNMQEIQANTVLGQINKLHDAYDQMLNTIGQANQGAIRNLLETLNDLVRNWQNVAYVLKWNVNWITIIGAALYALSRNYLKGATTQTLWFAKSMGLSSKTLLKNTADVKIFSKALGDFTLRQRMAIVATRTFQGALSKLGGIAKAIWPLLVFEGAVLLIERLFRARRELKRFREELEAVTSENVGRMNEEISGYDALIKKLEKTNKGTAARKEILDEISNKYGKYLDFIVTEKTTVEELAGAYDNVVSSIRNYTAEKIREEQQQRLEKGIYDEYQDLIESLTGARITDKNGNISKITKEQAKNIAKVIQQSLDEYGVADIQSILETYFGHALGFTSAGGENAGLGNIIRSYINEYNSLKQELQDIRNDIEGETPVFSSDAEYEDYKNRVQAANAALAEQAKRNEQINNLIKENNKEQWQADDALSKQRIANSEAELRIRRKYNLITQQEYESSLARLHGQLDNYETDYNNRLKKALQSMSSFGPLWLTLDKDARDMYNYVVSTEDALQQGTEQRNKQLKESYKGLKDSLKQYQDALAAGGDKDALNKNITWTKLMIKAIELAAKLRGIDLTDNKKGGTARNYDSISSLISLLKEMNSEYDKLSKSAYGFAKSNQKVVESFSPAFKEIFGFAGIDISQVDTTSKRSTADAMKLVIDTLDKKNLWGKFGSDGGKKARKEFVKAWSQMDVEADIDVQVRIREDFGRQMEEAFGNYELTLDLQKLNLPKGLAAEMWGIEETDLQDLRARLTEMYNGLRDENGQLYTDAFKDYEKFLNKIDDFERKQQRERLKDYAKYLETQYSDRVKIEMEYIQKLSRLEAETAIPEAQKSAIREGLRKEFDEKSRKQDWEDFKGSEFYVEMMEDLEKQGTASLEVMRKKLLEMRANAENLSPRALKEVVNALEKIDEIERKRTQPLKRVRDAQRALEGVNMKEVYEELAINQEQLALSEEQERSMERAIMLIQKRNELEKQGYTIEEARVRLSQANQARDFAQSALDAFKSDGSKESQDNLATLEQVLNNAKADVEKWQEIVNILSGKAVIDEQAKGNNYTTLGLSELQERRKNIKQSIKDLEGVIGKEEELAKLNKELNDAWDATYEAIKGWVSSVQNVFDGVMDNVDYFSDSTYGMVSAWKEFGDTSVSALNDLVSGIQAYRKANAEAEKNNAATGLFTANGLQLALVVLGVLMKIVQAIAKQHDAALDKQIQKQQERIDALRDAYARLEKQIEKTWSSVSYMQTYEQQVQNIREQIDAMEAQMRAEEAKKNTDDNAVRQYQRDIQDAYDQLEELELKSIEVFGGIGEEGYRSAAEGFVDAWKSAFLETGDGLQGLQDHFDEFLQDWFVKQATMRIAGGMLEPVFRQIDAAVDKYGEGGTSAMLSEIERVRDMAATIFPDLSLALEDLAGMFGAGGEGSLSGLAAGIQGMTEEQANILEAYWNSVRMNTASIDMNVSRIAEMLGVGGANTNPMLEEMKNIANNTAYIKQIYELLAPTAVNLGQGKGFRNYSV